MTAVASRFGLLSLGLALAGCQPTPLGDGLPAGRDYIHCTGCHGQNSDPTPPPAVDGTTSTESIGVGAHQAHMLGSSMAAPVMCTECHIVPQDFGGREHPDPVGRPARMVFGPLATTGPSLPAWDRGARTCAHTYCHGDTLRDADKRPAPVWTRVDGSQAKCDSCHGDPPPPTHTDRTDCEACHGQVVSARWIIKDPSLHVDGIVEAEVEP